MLTEETKKRIYVGVLIGAAILGLIFVIFAVFINRGTLTVMAKAPYVVNILQLKNVACPSDVCSSVIAPGDYTITVKKQGYKDVTRQLSIPISGEHKEEIVFEFIPVIAEIGTTADQQIFSKTSLESLESSQKTQLPATGLFFEEKYVAYTARNPETRRQTLYYRTIQAGKLGPETVATSFIRDIEDYLLIPEIEGQNKIGVIDNAENQSALYVLDLQEKTRTKLLTYPVIKDLRWLPESSHSGDFLFEARESGEVTESIFIYRAESGEVTKLDLQTPLKNIAIVSDDRLIAATMQYVGETDNLAALEGSLVMLGEIEATPSIEVQLESATALKFVDFSLVSLQSRLIKVAPDLKLPQEVKLSEDKKSLYFLLAVGPAQAGGDKVYGLQFSD